MVTPIRVLHVISGLTAAGGGTTRALIDMVKGQRAAGIDARILTSFRQGDSLESVEECHDSGIPVVRIGPVIGKRQTGRDLGPAVSSQIDMADLVHLHGLWEEIQFLASRICWSQRIPYVVSPHGMLDGWSVRQRRLLKVAYRWWRLNRILARASAIHLTTTEEAQNAQWLPPKVPQIVQPLGLDYASYVNLPVRGEFRRRHLIGRENDRMILLLSRLHPKKGISDLIEAFSRLKGDRGVLVLVGPVEPAYREELTNLIRKKGLCEEVIFTGILQGSEKIQAYVDADVFVLPSYQENFGIAVVEALAARTPVIISDRVNLASDLIGRTATHVVQTGADDLTKSLQRFFEDSPWTVEEREQSRQFVFSHFELDQVGAAWAKHYQTLTGVASAPNRFGQISIHHSADAREQHQHSEADRLAFNQR